MTNIKSKLEKITNAGISKGVQKSRDRKSKPWLKYYSSPIAMRVLTILKEEDLPQTKLADDLEVTPQQISKIVKGQENLTLETIYKLSTALNFDLLAFPPYKYSRQSTLPVHQISIDSNSSLISGEKFRIIKRLLEDGSFLNKTTKSDNTIPMSAGQTILI